MFSIFCLGVALWLIYGFMVNDIPVIAANLLTLMLASTLLFFKLAVQAIMQLTAEARGR